MATTIDDLFKQLAEINTNLQQIESTISSTLPALVTNSTYASQALAFMMKQNQAILCNLGQIFSMRKPSRRRYRSAWVPPSSI